MSKPFRQTLLEVEAESRANKIKELLNEDFIIETNNGFHIDVVKLVERLDKKEALLIKEVIETTHN